jgi:cytochrome b involved in lipid metabolism
MRGAFTMDEVRLHSGPASAWIAVNGKVYDITKFLAVHPGWTTGCGVSTVLAILRCLGTECSEEWNYVHSKTARNQMRSYYIGELVDGEDGRGSRTEQTKQKG